MLHSDWLLQHIHQWNLQAPAKLTSGHIVLIWLDPCLQGFPKEFLMKFIESFGNRIKKATMTKLGDRMENTS